MLPNILKNMNAFVDGVGYIGKIHEVEPPKISLKTESYEAGGMLGEVEVEHGIEKLEATLTFGGFIPELAKLFNRPGIDGVPLRLAGVYENDESLKRDSVELILRGRIKELDLGNWKRGGDNKFKVTLPLTYYKLMVNGQRFTEVDIINMKWVDEDGNDRYEAQREALGV